MNQDFLATLNDLPARHRGVLFEQLHLAAITSTFTMRGLGISLPGETKIPTQAEVFAHLCNMANFALQGYMATSSEAPATVAANEIIGEYGDDLFWVELTGLSRTHGDGFSVQVDANQLYKA